MIHHVKVAICYHNDTKTVLRKNHIKTITKDVGLYFLEPINVSKRYSRKPLFA